MKHLESIHRYPAKKYSIGDYIKLIKLDNNGWDYEHGFRLGELFIIQHVDYGETYPYLVLSLSSNEKNRLAEFQFRLATDEEIATHKYNL